MPPPGAATVDATATSQLSAPLRYVPIIVVPGIMGSRLAEPGGDHALAWNPKGWPVGNSACPFAANAPRLRNWRAPLVPDEWNQYTRRPDLAQRANRITNFYHVIADYYDQLCYAMEGDLTNELHDRGLQTRVYCSGYDWRRDLRVGAHLLAEVVRKARLECNDEQVILIAHSMGGLVSRYFCRMFGGQHQVRALYLLGSPSMGAPEVYARLKRGIVSTDGPDLMALRTLMQLTQLGSRELLRNFPGMYQLLPNAIYCRHEPGWMTFDRTQTGYPYLHTEGASDTRAELSDCSSGYPLYRDLFTGFAEDPSNRTEYVGQVDKASDFHGHLSALQGVKAYMHPNTHAVICEDKDTTTIAELQAWGHVVEAGGNYEYRPTQLSPISWTEPVVDRINGLGDSSVTAFSANPPGNVLLHPFRSVHRVSQVAHGDLPNDPGVISHLVASIKAMQF